MKICDLMSEKNIVFLDTKDMKSTIEKMVDSAFENKRIENKEEFLKFGLLLKNF